MKQNNQLEIWSLGARPSRDTTDTRLGVECTVIIHWQPNFCWLVNKDIINLLIHIKYF